MRGQMTLLQQGKKQVVGNLGGGDDLKGLIKVNDWNQLHIIARGNALTHVLNGRLMAAAIDDDATNRATEGVDRIPDARRASDEGGVSQFAKESLMKKLFAISSAALLAAVSSDLSSEGPARSRRASQGQPRGGGGLGSGIEALAPDDHTGFESIFDGKSLKGWEGDTVFWRVENEAIVGESTAEKHVVKGTTLSVLGAVGQPKDFELKLEYRINSTNSGLQYRSVELPEVGKWVLKGYQADHRFPERSRGIFLTSWARPPRHARSVWDATATG